MKQQFHALVSDVGGNSVIEHLAYEASSAAHATAIAKNGRPQDASVQVFTEEEFLTFIGSPSVPEGAAHCGTVPFELLSSDGSTFFTKTGVNDLADEDLEEGATLAAGLEYFSNSEGAKVYPYGFFGKKGVGEIVEALDAIVMAARKDNDDLWIGFTLADPETNQWFASISLTESDDSTNSRNVSFNDLPEVTQALVEKFTART